MSLLATDTDSRSIGAAHLDAMLAIEQRAYSHPWSRQNFEASLASGHRLQGFWRGDALVGYSVSMRGADEMHLLNFTITPELQGQGLSRLLFRDLCDATRHLGFHAIWLEVRASNQRAIAVYERFGFSRTGMRKGYYPMSRTEREDAILMSLDPDLGLRAAA